MNSNVCSLINPMLSTFKGSLLSACDVTGWDSELGCWTRNGEMGDDKMKIILECFDIKA